MDITPGYLSSIKREIAEADAEYAELRYPKHYRGLDYKYGEGTRYFEDVYASFSDGELLELIRERRERTGRPPRDFQFLDLYVTYIIDRFLHWNGALSKALPEEVKEQEKKEIAAVNRITLIDKRLPHLYQIAKSRVFEYPPFVNRRRDAMEAMKLEYNLDNAHTEFYIKLLKRVCRNRRLFGDAGPAYTKPIEQFKNISETLGRPPTIAEVPDTLGMTLWYAAGDWYGVYRLCGFPYMDRAQRNQAEMEYGALHATPEMLPSNKRNKLSESEYGALAALCGKARKLGRTPETEDMTGVQIEALRKVSLDVNVALRLIGLIPKLNEKKAAKESQRERL
ncbi:MAG: hypothetical protein LBK57_00790 [Clostridiales Family XIII bacterium]|jgi:hypothetical protein|nr:hypothetical protein [Clostridiales Family XIII bacterium]